PEQVPSGVVRFASGDGSPAALGEHHLRGGHRDTVLIDYRDEQGLIRLRFGGSCHAGEGDVWGFCKAYLAGDSNLSLRTQFPTGRLCARLRGLGDSDNRQDCQKGGSSEQSSRAFWVCATRKS